MLGSLGLTGTIPSEIFSMTRLGMSFVGMEVGYGWVCLMSVLFSIAESLTLEDNEIAGTIGTEIGRLQDLRT